MLNTNLKKYDRKLPYKIVCKIVIRKFHTQKHMQSLIKIIIYIINNQN